MCFYDWAHCVTFYRIRDSPSLPALTSCGYMDSTGMTVESCDNTCQIKTIFTPVSKMAQIACCGFVIHTFWTPSDCRNVLTAGSGLSAPSSDCSSKCVGDSSERCGGSDRLNLYWSETQPFWEYAGYYSDSNDARTLTEQVCVQGGEYNNTVENYISACSAAGYVKAGQEFANQLWHSFENCGGADALILYNYVGST
ncbi:hypothetical protein EI94DRAFT_1707538 [Lactarius quietus]|nr:hypothetical protein EI94DRAFT_1707538 [Lactarius quietus]